MIVTYKAMLRGNRLVWQEPLPVTVGDVEEVPVYVTFVREQEPGLEERQAQVKQLLEEMVASGVFSEIEDPVAWQREIRQDRPSAWGE